MYEGNAVRKSDPRGGSGKSAPILNSITTKNFFVMVSAEFHPTKEVYTFAEVLVIVRDNLRRQINREHLEKLFSYNVSNEKLLAARAVPLFLKNIAMKLVYTKSALANTTTITNIGNIGVDEEYRHMWRCSMHFLQCRRDSI